MTIRDAHHIEIGVCDDPECTAVHIQLHEETGEPFAQAVIASGDGLQVFIEKIRTAAYFAVTTKEERQP